MKNFKKLIIFSLFLFLFLGFFKLTKAANPLNQALTTKIKTQTSGIAGSAYDTNSKATSVYSVIASAIRTFLTLLGIIFLILMLYGGFLWMTAGGEEEQVKKALSIIRNAIIGLVIIVAAYAITEFVFGAFGKGSSTGGGSSAGGGTMP